MGGFACTFCAKNLSKNSGKICAQICAKCAHKNFAFCKIVHSAHFHEILAPLIFREFRMTFLVFPGKFPEKRGCTLCTFLSQSVQNLHKICTKFVHKMCSNLHGVRRLNPTVTTHFLVKFVCVKMCVVHTKNARAHILCTRRAHRICTPRFFGNPV